MLYLIQEDVMVLKIAFVGFIFILNPQMEMKKICLKAWKRLINFCIYNSSYSRYYYMVVSMINFLPPIFREWDCLRYLWGKNMQVLTYQWFLSYLLNKHNRNSYMQAKTSHSVDCVTVQSTTLHSGKTRIPTLPFYYFHNDLGDSLWCYQI